MAKWGEGDPRWIVEDRPDSTNVNNWHWSAVHGGRLARVLGLGLPGARGLTPPAAAGHLAGGGLRGRTEKNCFPWAEQYLRAALGEVRADGADGLSANVKEVTSIEGDVTLGNRKGKVYNLYDLTIVLAWEGMRGPTAAPDPRAQADVH